MDPALIGSRGGSGSVVWEEGSSASGSRGMGQ